MLDGQSEALKSGFLPSFLYKKATKIAFWGWVKNG